MYYIKSFGRSMAVFVKDECFYLAASISYFLIVSLVPLSLLMVTLFGHILGESQDIYQFALSRLISFFPSVTDGITVELRKLITYKGISWIMIIVYSFLSLQLFYSMEHAMNIIFRVPKKRHFLLSFLWTIIIVTLVIGFLLLSFTVSSLAGVFAKYQWNILGVEIGYKASIFVKYIAPFLLVLMTFTAIYTIVPRVKVLLKYAFAGSLLVTVLWELGKHFFTWYVKNVIQLGTIYGSLTTFILFLLWMYYSSCIFLLGGEFVSSLSGRS